MSNKVSHPKEYRYVVFMDEAANYSFLTRSTAQSEETIKWEDGQEYPLIKVQISSASHPFFTGEEKIIDTEGRVDRFKARAKRAEALRATLGNKVKKAEKEAVKKAEKAEAKQLLTVLLRKSPRKGSFLWCWVAEMKSGGQMAA